MRGRCDYKGWRDTRGVATSDGGRDKGRGVAVLTGAARTAGTTEERERAGHRRTKEGNVRRREGAIRTAEGCWAGLHGGSDHTAWRAAGDDV